MIRSIGHPDVSHPQNANVTSRRPPTCIPVNVPTYHEFVGLAPGGAFWSLRTPTGHLPKCPVRDPAALQSVPTAQVKQVGKTGR